MSVEEKVIRVLSCECLRCGYKWTSKKNVRPPCCAKCGRKYWWLPGKNSEGNNMGRDEPRPQEKKVVEFD